MNEPEKRPENSLVNDDDSSVEAASSDSPTVEPDTTQAAPTTPEPNSAPVTEPTVESVVETTAEETKPNKRPVWMYVAAFGVVAVTVIAILFILEKEGRSSTGLFDSYFEQQAATAIVATVNGEEINGGELDSSIEQFTQVAFAQGIDVSNPEIQNEIRQQSLDVLVNTELLRQEAIDRGLSVEAGAAEERLAAIEADLGGPEELQARIEELGMDKDSLIEDIRDEMLIQKLLDSVFADSGLMVTEEEVNALYEQTGGEEAGLPPLKEVREQVEAQILATKEQQLIDTFLNQLREEAAIETF